MKEKKTWLMARSIRDLNPAGSHTTAASHLCLSHPETCTPVCTVHLLNCGAHDTALLRREHFPKHEVPRWHGRHVLIEYVMLHAVNDLPEHAAELLQLLRPVECKVNLIVFNTHEGAAFSASSPDAVQHFRWAVQVPAGLA